MPVVRVSTKGQVVIPKKVREELGIEPGTYVSIQNTGTDIILTPLGSDPIEAMYGILADCGPGTADLLAERREERRREERKEAWIDKTLFRRSS